MGAFISFVVHMFKVIFHKGEETWNYITDQVETVLNPNKLANKIFDKFLTGDYEEIVKQFTLYNRANPDESLLDPIDIPEVLNGYMLYLFEVDNLDRLDIQANLLETDKNWIEALSLDDVKLSITIKTPPNTYITVKALLSDVKDIQKETNVGIELEMDLQLGLELVVDASLYLNKLYRTDKNVKVASCFSINQFDINPLLQHTITGNRHPQNVLYIQDLRFNTLDYDSIRKKSCAELGGKYEMSGLRCARPDNFTVNWNHDKAKCDKREAELHRKGQTPSTKCTKVPKEHWYQREYYRGSCPSTKGTNPWQKKDGILPDGVPSQPDTWGKSIWKRDGKKCKLVDGYCPEGFYRSKKAFHLCVSEDSLVSNIIDTAIKGQLNKDSLLSTVRPLLADLAYSKIKDAGMLDKIKPMLYNLINGQVDENAKFSMGPFSVRLEMSTHDDCLTCHENKLTYKQCNNLVSSGGYTKNPYRGAYLLDGVPSHDNTCPSNLYFPPLNGRCFLNPQGKAERRNRLRAESKTSGGYERNTINVYRSMFK